MENSESNWFTEKLQIRRQIKKKHDVLNSEITDTQSIHGQSILQKSTVTFKERWSLKMKVCWFVSESIELII